MDLTLLRKSTNNILRYVKHLVTSHTPRFPNPSIHALYFFFTFSTRFEFVGDCLATPCSKYWQQHSQEQKVRPIVPRLVVIPVLIRRHRAQTLYNSCLSCAFSAPCSGFPLHGLLFFTDPSVILLVCIYFVNRWTSSNYLTADHHGQGLMQLYVAWLSWQGGRPPYSSIACPQR